MVHSWRHSITCFLAYNTSTIIFWTRSTKNDCLWHSIFIFRENMYVGHKVTELQIVWSLCHLIKSGAWIMSPVCWRRSKVTCYIELSLKGNSWTIFYWALGNIICLSLRQRQIKCINHKSGINWKSVSAQIVDFGTVLQGVSVARQVCACVWGVQLSGINEPALGEGLLYIMKHISSSFLYL